MKRALITAAILSIITMPAFAQYSPQNQQSAAKNRSLGYASAPKSTHENTRSEALQTCNAEAAKWSNRDYQTTQATMYRDCMMKHGQSE
jgi:Tfp pilus assembly protein PilE